MSIFNNNCPVPFDQQPLNEYLSLKNSCLFSWSMSDVKKFILGLLFIFVFVSTVISFFLIHFTYSSNIIDLFILNFLFSNIFVFLVFIRIYLGWSYIMKRLLSATIFYEESGWYDGQIWVKTSEYLMQDRLIGLYQVMPFLVRIKFTSLIIFFNIFLSYLLYYFF
uniref:Ycf36 n=1 Tax=Ophidocladus simpliciusculus TaxID=1261574 RepID=A0A1Z1MJT3_9FLOR|nr:hypothetical protein [Ophidocladus simpliciusculus]ARW66014.1 hypothetical protein [Ophidocladus simpliciusculus]